MSIEERIKDGLNGKYKGLSNGLSRINNYIFGLQKKCYYLLGGNSGTFKTTLCDFILINALLDAEKKNIPVNIYYYSFEIDSISKQCNWLSNIAYQKYKRVISPEKIKGLGDFRLNSEEQEIIKDCIIDLNKIWSKINFTFNSINPTGIYNTLWKTMETRGKFEYEEYIDHENNPKKKIKNFTLNNPEEYNIVIIDHYFLLRKERGFTSKEVIDKMSEYFVELRNTFGMTIITVQQFNSALSSIDRQKFKGADISPGQSDFRDSTNPYQDCDIALGIMNPAKLDMEECLGYDLSKIDKMIMLKIIKNRLSEDNIAIGLQADPKAGSFRELPKPDEINYNDFKL